MYALVDRELQGIERGAGTYAVCTILFTSA